MADLSQLFGAGIGQPPVQRERGDNFGAGAQFGAELKRKMVMGEVRQQGLTPEDGDQFFQFVGKRLFELGDVEGALSVAQQRQQMMAAQAQGQQQGFQNDIALREIELKEKNAKAKGNSKLSTITGPQAEALGLPGDGVFQINPETNKITTVTGSKLMSPQELNQRIQIAGATGAVAAQLAGDRTAATIEGARAPLQKDLQASTNELLKLGDTLKLGKTGLSLASRGRFKAAVDDFATALAAARNLRGEAADSLIDNVRGLFNDPSISSSEDVRAITEQAVARFGVNTQGGQPKVIDFSELPD